MKVTVVEWVVLEVGLGVKLCEDGWVVRCGCVWWVVMCAKWAPVGAWAPPEDQEACLELFPWGLNPHFISVGQALKVVMEAVVALTPWNVVFQPGLCQEDRVWLLRGFRQGKNRSARTAWVSSSLSRAKFHSFTSWNMANSCL